MASSRWTFRAVICCAMTLQFGGSVLLAQRFADPVFRPYTLKSVQPTSVEKSLRRFLDDRVTAGEPIEIVSDDRGQRLLVHGSEEVQVLAKKYIEALDLPAITTEPATNPIQPAIGQAANVRGYFAATMDELRVKEAALKELFANRKDVRIAVDERTRQLVIYAPASVHQQIDAKWNDPAFERSLNKQASAPGIIPPRRAPVPNNPGMLAPAMTSRSRHQLSNISWQDLLKSLRGVQGADAKVSAPNDGMLSVNIASKNGQQTQFLIDLESQIVQISGPSDETQQWSQVVQALDNRPGVAEETRMAGRLGNAQPKTISRTIAMLGAANQSREQLARPIGQRNSRPRAASEPERQPMMLAQANGGQGGIVEQRGTLGSTQRGGESEVLRMLGDGDSSGSFLGPVAIEFIEGTDIFIVRGQKRDVDRVMRLINDIERLTQDTEPAVEAVQLKHANSAALAELINQLNDEVLQARQGDVSVTPLVKPNSILLIGRPNGVESVKKIIQALDVEAEASDQFKVINLTYLPAVDAETTINNLYNLTQAGQAQTDETATLRPRVRAVADYRSNSLVVQAGPRDLQEIEDLLRDLDVEGGGNVSEVRVFRLKNAISEEVAEVLRDTLQTRDSQQAQAGQIGQQGGFGGAGAGGQVNTQPTSSPQSSMLEIKVLDAKADVLLDRKLESGILSNVIVTSNERSNAVVVTAPKGSMELIAEIVRQLDELPAQEAEIRVFNIVNGDASLLVEMLNTLFEQDQQNNQGPLIQSAAGTGESTLVPLRFALDLRTNSIIASGNAADLRVVEAILLKLDSSDVSRRRSAVVDLQIQQAVAVADAIQQFVQLRRQAVLGIAQDTISQYDLLDQEVVVVAEPENNKLIVNATDRYFDDIMEIIQELDRRPDMVLVQVLIAEITLNSTEELGVELGLQDSLLFNRGSLAPGFNFNNQPLGTNATDPGTFPGTLAGQALSDLGLARTNGELGFGGLVLSASNESVSILLRALQESRRLEILSRPQIMMLNNTEGSVQVGADVPYVSDVQNNINGVTNVVDFRQVGLILTVRPRIGPDGMIALNVVANRSNLGAVEDGIPISAQDGVVIRAPIFEETSTETFVTARDGQTVILGGLIQKTQTSFQRKVPYLGDIPLVGRLFRSDAVTEERKELLIILTPQIVRDQADIDRVNSEEYARMSWCLGNVIEMHGDVGRRYYRDYNRDERSSDMGVGEGTGIIGQEGMMYESPGEILQGVSNGQPYSGQGYQEPTYSSQTPVQGLQAKPFEQPVYSESTAQPAYNPQTNSQTMPVYQTPVYQTPASSPQPAINSVPPVTNAAPPVQHAPSKPRTIKAAGRSALFPLTKNRPLWNEFQVENDRKTAAMAQSAERAAKLASEEPAEKADPPANTRIIQPVQFRQNFKANARKWQKSAQKIGTTLFSNSRVEPQVYRFEEVPAE